MEVPTGFEDAGGDDFFESGSGEKTGAEILFEDFESDSRRGDDDGGEVAADGVDCGVRFSCLK